MVRLCALAFIALVAVTPSWAQGADTGSTLTGARPDPRAAQPDDGTTSAAAATTTTTTTTTSGDDAGGAAVLDPATAATAPLPTDDELRALAARDMTAARGPLRRAARTAPTATTRALGLRLLAQGDPTTATARICARSLRLDVAAEVRRAGAECLGRLGPRLAGSHTAALVSALDDTTLDVVTMAGWALSNVGDAGAIGPVAARMDHPDSRVGVLFRGYATRLRDRLGLQYDADDGLQPAQTDGAPIAVPPGVALTLPASGLDQAAATGWLGVYGAMAGWVYGPLMLSAHGGVAGAEASSLAALGAAAVGSASLSAYAFSRADRLQLAHTVVQMGTFGGLAGYGAGLLSDVGAASGVASANLSLLGFLGGTGLGMAMVELRPPSMGALTLGMGVGVGVGIAGGSLAASYRYPFDQSLGVLLLSGSVAGATTMVLLAEEDIGLYPSLGAGVGMLAGAGVGSLAAVASESVEQSTEASGWMVVGGLAVGAALGGSLGLLVPQEWDPFLLGTLKLRPPTVGVVPGYGPAAAPVTTAMVSGTF